MWRTRTRQRRRAVATPLWTLLAGGLAFALTAAPASASASAEPGLTSAGSDRPAATHQAFVQPAAPTDPPDDGSPPPDGSDSPSPGDPPASPGPDAPGTDPPTTPPEPSSDPPPKCPAVDGDKVSPSEPWNQKRLQYERVHQVSHGRGVRIAVIDSGLSPFTRQTWADPGSTPASPADATLSSSFADGESFADDPYDWKHDCDGHGTAVAGLIAAQPWAGKTPVGIAPGASILSLRYTTGSPVDPDKGGQEDESSGGNDALAEAIDYAVDEGVDIINISSSSTSRKDLREPIQRAISAGILVVAAAGNTGDEGNQVMYPAALPGVLAVGAVNKSGERSTFSQHSFPLSVVAPGEGLTLVATRSGYHTADDQTAGTSFAAPLVTGTAALVMSKYPDLSAEQVRKRIEQTADPVAGSSMNEYGHGIVNPYEALTAVLPDNAGATMTPYDDAPPVKGAAPPPPPGQPGQDVALAIAAGALAAALLTWIAVRTVRRGRLRGWRPARRTPSS